MMDNLHPQYVVDGQGKPQSVLLAINEYEELLECVQDVLDASEIERLRGEPRFSWSEVKAAREAKLKE